MIEFRDTDQWTQKWIVCVYVFMHTWKMNCFLAASLIAIPNLAWQTFNIHPGISILECTIEWVNHLYQLLFFPHKLFLAILASKETAIQVLRSIFAVQHLYQNQIPHLLTSATIKEKYQSFCQ